MAVGFIKGGHTGGLAKQSVDHYSIDSATLKEIDLVNKGPLKKGCVLIRGLLCSVLLKPFCKI